MKTNFNKRKIYFVGTLFFVSLFVGLISTLIADTLKLITGNYEHQFYFIFINNKWLIFILPVIGLLTIYILRHFLFRNQQNKGIKEVLESVNRKEHNLPPYKIISHYFNGFLTVAFGGSTGIEVSTVVISATIGSVSSQKTEQLKNYKTELICAGLAAGITALFNAPLAGMLFAFEVFSKKLNKVYVFSILTSITIAYFINRFIQSEPLLKFDITHWNSRAFPYFILLGILAGVNSVYLTKCVLFFKKFFFKINNEALRISIGALTISVLIFFIPQLYGDGYLAIHDLSNDLTSLSFNIILSIGLILIAKPIITSITLSVGGDGGVFAPSLFIGAFLGALTAFILNYFFNADVIPINFLVIGMASFLSGIIHAPFTSVFLVCALTGNYTLFIPILIACFISKLVSSFIFPFTVYNYYSIVRPLS